MPRYIDAEPLLEKAQNLEKTALQQVRKAETNEMAFFWQTILTERTAFKYDLMDTPEVDVAPIRRGKWYRVVSGYSIGCSVCHHRENAPTIMGEPTTWKFCPNCGARMEGECD